MERFDSAFQDSIFVFIADHDPLFPATLSCLSLYMIIYVDWIYAIVSKLWLFDKRRTLLTRLYLVVEKSGEKCVHVYETYNGRKLVRLATESLNFLILKFEEKYNKFNVQPWTKENDTSRNLNLVRVYRNIHLIVMDQLSKDDLLFMDKKRNVILSHYFHPIFSFLDLELHK